MTLADEIRAWPEEWKRARLALYDVERRVSELQDQLDAVDLEEPQSPSNSAEQRPPFRSKPHDQRVIVLEIELERAQAEVSKVRAATYTRIREQMENTGKRPTETALQRAVEVHTEYQAAKAHAQEVSNRLKLAQAGLDDDGQRVEGVAEPLVDEAQRVYEEDYAVWKKRKDSAEAALSAAVLEEKRFEIDVATAERHGQALAMLANLAAAGQLT